MNLSVYLNGPSVFTLEMRALLLGVCVVARVHVEVHWGFGQLGVLTHKFVRGLGYGQV